MNVAIVEDDIRSADILREYILKYGKENSVSLEVYHFGGRIPQKVPQSRVFGYISRYRPPRHKRNGRCGRHKGSGQLRSHTFRYQNGAVRAKGLFRKRARLPFKADKLRRFQR